jgi:hypothetical protein
MHSSHAALNAFLSAPNSFINRDDAPDRQFLRVPMRSSSCCLVVHTFGM